ncbi:MAG: YihY/virulence factor BrkB family protein [Vicinamibacterales bacterium]
MRISYFHPPMPWWAILKKTAIEIDDDNCLGLAAQLAFYGLMALFPALLFLVALLGYLPVEGVAPGLLAALSRVAPRELTTIVREQLDQIATGGQAGLLTIGILGALWSSSAGMVAIIDALNRAYDVSEWRPWWKSRLTAIGLTVAVSIFIVLSFVLVLLGPGAANWVAHWVGLGPVVTLVWPFIRWPLMVACVLVGVDLVYHFAPNRRVQWTWVTPGALVAVALWIAASFGFKFYITSVTDYAATYGTIGGAIVTLLWFYVSGLTVLVGAELNGTIEHAWVNPLAEAPPPLPPP